MRGVGDQPPLRRLGALQRLHHLVEAGRQAPQLVVAAHLDPPGQVVGPRDLLGRVRDLAGGRQRRAGDDRAQRRGQRDAAGADQEQDQDQGREGVLGVLQRGRDLEGGAVRERLGQHPQRGVSASASSKLGSPPLAASSCASVETGISIGVPGVGITSPSAPMIWPRAGGAPGPGAGAAGSSPGGPVPWGDAGCRARSPCSKAAQPYRAALGLVAQVVVDLVAEAVAHERVDDRRGEHHGQRDRGRREQRQPAAQAHFSRSE